MEKIKKFLFPDNLALTKEENIRIKNRSNHDNIAYQTFFCSIDEFAKGVVLDIHNYHSVSLFEANNLNLLSDERTIANMLLGQPNASGHSVNKISNPEMIYKAFRFVKPSN